MCGTTDIRPLVEAARTIAIDRLIRQIAYLRMRIEELETAQPEHARTSKQQSLLPEVQ